MKKTLLLILLVAAGCAKKDEPPKPEEKKSESPWKLSRNTNGEPVLTLDEATQKRVGLQLAPLAAAQLTPEVKAYGRVLDPAALATAVAESVAARAMAEASQKEFERIKILAGQNNASTRTLQTAEAAALRDSAQADAARIRLRTAWGEAITDSKDLRGVVESLAAGASALVRLDLPAGEVLKSVPTGARVFAMADEGTPFEAKFLGAAANVDAQTQGRGFFFLVTKPQGQFKPGGAVLGYLGVAGDAQSGVLVPREAVIHADGHAWVYLQTGAGAFTRKEITTAHALAGGWFVREPLGAGDRVVVIGAQQLLSEELKGQGGGD